MPSTSCLGRERPCSQPDSKHARRQTHVDPGIDGFAEPAPPEAEGGALEATVIAAALSAAVRHAGKGVFALCGQGRLLFANDIARTCVGPLGPLCVRQGRLRAAGPDARDLAEALARLESAVQPQFFTLCRPAGAGDGSLPAQRFAVTALPVDGASSTACRVLILDPLGEQGSLDAAALARWLGLTPAQARVAACLSRGLTPEAVAAHCGRSIATVRKQIRAILERSGIENLQQLYRALAGLGRGYSGPR